MATRIYDSSFSGAQIDAGIEKANTALQSDTIVATTGTNTDKVMNQSSVTALFDDIVDGTTTVGKSTNAINAVVNSDTTYSSLTKNVTTNILTLGSNTILQRNLVSSVSITDADASATQMTTVTPTNGDVYEIVVQLIKSATGETSSVFKYVIGSNTNSAGVFPLYCPNSATMGGTYTSHFLWIASGVNFGISGTGLYVKLATVSSSGYSATVSLYKQVA